MKFPTIPAPSVAAADAARARQQILTKPRGSLGRLEALSVQLAAIQDRAQPVVQKPAVVIMAGDHGITAEGVSAYPQEVTAQMVLNFANGGAAVNVLARQVGADVRVIDIGVAGTLPAGLQIGYSKVAPGTHNMREEDAMDPETVARTLQTGMDLAGALAAEGHDLVALGEMGIGNTSAASVLTALYCKHDISELVGRGTGIDDAGLIHKRNILQEVTTRMQAHPRDALQILAGAGGLEIAGLAGLTIGAAAHRMAVVTDGYIATAAVLAATALQPEVLPYIIASHCSQEPGHHVQLAHLGLVPLLDLDLRLGEGSGAVLAIPLIQAAARTLSEMATFASAGVSNQQE